MLLCKCTFMHHSDPLMTELIPTINEIVKCRIQLSLTVADREKVLEKNLIKIYSLLRSNVFQRRRCVLVTKDLKHYTKRPAKAETLMRSRNLQPVF